MMHLRVNELEIQLQLRPAGPLLIKEGEQPDDKAGAEAEARQIMRFVRTSRAGEGAVFYLPGAGIKGALRSAAERRVRALGGFEPSRVRCCDPLGKNNCGARAVAAAKAAEEAPRGAEIYNAACPICRCFGHVRLAGRWRIGDALPLGEAGRIDESHKRGQRQRPAGPLPTRDGVGISRRTGGVEPHLLYSYETLEGVNFRAHLTLQNYELWQLGLLAYLLDDFEQGAIRLGYGTRRGMGLMKVEPLSLSWRFPAAPPPMDGDRLVLTPLGAQAELLERGYAPLDGKSSLPVGPVTPAGEGPLRTWTMRREDPGFGAGLEGLWEVAAAGWSRAMSEWPEVNYG